MIALPTRLELSTNLSDPEAPTTLYVDLVWGARDEENGARWCTATKPSGSVVELLVGDNELRTSSWGQEKGPFRCECLTPERALYVVTDHKGGETRALYCDGCRDLALIDWSGETKSIALVHEAPFFGSA